MESMTRFAHNNQMDDRTNESYLRNDAYLTGS